MMEKVLRRSLRPEETVHHKNLVKHDNRPENLELWASRHPSGSRVTDLVEYAKEILNLYGEEVELLKSVSDGRAEVKEDG